MAVYTYTNTITQIDASTIRFEISGLTPPSVSWFAEDSAFQNTITMVSTNMISSYPVLPFPASYDLTSTVAAMGSVFADAVYRYASGLDAAPDYYTSDDCFLVTTAIDAGIPLMPQTTGREIATYNAAVSIRQDIQDYFDAADYANANIWIIYLTNLLSGLSAGGEINPVIATLPAANTVNTELTDTTAVFPTAFGYCNVLVNTLTLGEYPYTWEFTPNSAVAQDNDAIEAVAYPDGVYTDNVSVLCTFNDSGNYPALINEGTGYLLVVTTITTGIANWQAAFNQLTNPSPQQIEDNDFLSGALAAIQAAFDAELYTEANALILQVQGVLAGGINILMYLNLATTGTKSYKEANMLNYFLSGTLPSGVYTDQSSILKNTITNEEYFFPSAYPTNATDYTEVLNSLDLTTENKWNDAVYRSSVSFKVGETQYDCVAYCLVLTRMDCVITKLTQSASLCGSLQTKLSKLISIRNMALNCFMVGNFTGANTQINKFNSVTATCNCGCR